MNTYNSLPSLSTSQLLSRSDSKFMRHAKTVQSPRGLCSNPPLRYQQIFTVRESARSTCPLRVQRSSVKATACRVSHALHTRYSELMNCDYWFQAACPITARAAPPTLQARVALDDNLSIHFPCSSKSDSSPTSCFRSVCVFGPKPTTDSLRSRSTG